MSNSDPKVGPKPGQWPPAPESAAMPPSSWAKRTGFKPKFSGETNASDSGQISLPPRPKEQKNSQPDVEAGRVRATLPQPPPAPPPAAVNGTDKAVVVPAENKDQTVVKRRRDSDGGSGGGAKKDGLGHGANGAGPNGAPEGPRRAVVRNEEVIDVEDDGFVRGRHTHMKYELRDTPGLGECFFLSDCLIADLVAARSVIMSSREVKVVCFFVVLIDNLNWVLFGFVDRMVLFGVVSSLD